MRWWFDSTELASAVIVMSTLLSFGSMALIFN